MDISCNDKNGPKLIKNVPFQRCEEILWKLRPAQPIISPVLQIPEYLLWKEKYYSLTDTGESSRFGILLYDNVEQALKRIVEIHGWDDCFSPCDSLPWVEISEYFGIADFFESGFFSFHPKRMRSCFQLIQSQNEKVRDLLQAGKMDFKTLKSMDSLGLELDDFSLYCIENSRFNGRVQLQILELFGSYFRREKITPEVFLEDNLDELSSLLIDKQRFNLWMRKTTLPEYSNLYDRRKQLLGKMQSYLNCKQINMEESLEEDWIELTLKLTKSSDSSRFGHVLSDKAFLQLIEEFQEL
jgi:hypothetical protein